MTSECPMVNQNPPEINNNCLAALDNYARIQEFDASKGVAVDPINRPSPLRTDSDNWFAHRTMAERIPENIELVASRNDYPQSMASDLRSLARAIREDDEATMFAPPAPDFESWFESCASVLPATWLHAPWMFAETFAYRKLIEAVRFWETAIDPFAPMKEDELSGAGPWELQAEALASDGSTEQQIASTLKYSLWGNRIDLSYRDSMHLGSRGHDSELIVDDSAAAAALLARPGGTVHLATDNTGSELAADLILADRLLSVEACTVVFEVKMHPTYVSDATAQDVLALVSRMSAHGEGLSGRTPADAAVRLRKAFEAGRFRIIPHLYWNSSRFLWELPDGILSALTSARILILKGDMNYRRLSGDGLWNSEVPFSTAAGYLPCPVLAVRTLKSDTLMGGPVDRIARLDREEPTWRSGGKYGAIQLCMPHAPLDQRPQ